MGLKRKPIPRPEPPAEKNKWLMPDCLTADFRKEYDQQYESAWRDQVYGTFRYAAGPATQVRVVHLNAATLTCPAWRDGVGLLAELVSYESPHANSHVVVTISRLTGPRALIESLERGVADLTISATVRARGEIDRMTAAWAIAELSSSFVQASAQMTILEGVRLVLLAERPPTHMDTRRIVLERVRRDSDRGRYPSEAELNRNRADYARYTADLEYSRASMTIDFGGWDGPAKIPDP